MSTNYYEQDSQERFEQMIDNAVWLGLIEDPYQTDEDEFEQLSLF